jgi:hypothetical protein
MNDKANFRSSGVSRARRDLNGTPAKIASRSVGEKGNVQPDRASVECFLSWPPAATISDVLVTGSVARLVCNGRIDPSECAASTGGRGFFPGTTFGGLSTPYVGSPCNGCPT